MGVSGAALYRRCRRVVSGSCRDSGGLLPYRTPAPHPVPPQRIAPNGTPSNPCPSLRLLYPPFLDPTLQLAVQPQRTIRLYCHVLASAVRLQSPPTVNCLSLLSSTRRAVEGMREALRTGAAAPLPPAEARAAASNDRFVNSHYETQQLMMRWGARVQVVWAVVWEVGGGGAGRKQLMLRWSRHGFVCRGVAMVRWGRVMEGCNVVREVELKGARGWWWCGRWCGRWRLGSGARTQQFMVWRRLETGSAGL